MPAREPTKSPEGIDNDSRGLSSRERGRNTGYPGEKRESTLKSSLATPSHAHGNEPAKIAAMTSAAFAGEVVKSWISANPRLSERSSSVS
jgi:hypothetical protein